jgi:hypothetical protein
MIAFSAMDTVKGNDKGYWPVFIEKAWAKVHGAYGNSVGG